MSDLPRSTLELDTFNRFGITAKGDKVLILMPVNILSRQEAITMASWLIAMSEILKDNAIGETIALVEAIQST